MGTRQRVAKQNNGVKENDSRLTKQVLADRFPAAEAYPTQYDSIQVRIIDSRFSGKDRGQREKMVLPLIHKLPEDVQSQIIVLLLFAPGEEGGSMLNFEFERLKKKAARR